MAFLGGCECVCWTLSPVVYVRMVRCIDKTLIQYVSAGPYNTRSGPQELPRPFRRNSAQAMRLFHKVALPTSDNKLIVLQKESIDQDDLPVT